MKIKIFADGSNIKEMFDLYENNPIISGFTTNPTLMAKAGVSDYSKFIREVVSKIKDKPISFEVFADDYEGMTYQAQKIASYGNNINVKIPITYANGESTRDVISFLLDKNIDLNITAVMTTDHILELNHILPDSKNNIVSIFAGRIADTGRSPKKAVNTAIAIIGGQASILWASPRQVYDIYQADSIGCDIITVTPDLIKKLSLFEKDLHQYTIETVKMFYNDAVSSGLYLQ